MGPCHFSDVGKEATDLLSKDFCSSNVFSVTANLNGLDIKAGIDNSPMYLRRKYFGGIQYQAKNKYSTLDIEAKTDRIMPSVPNAVMLAGAVTHHELGVPGLKMITHFPVFGKMHGKAELEYWNDFVGVTAGMVMTKNPFVGMTGTVGTKNFAVGSNFVFNTDTKNFNVFDASLRISAADHTVAAFLANRGRTINASYHYLVGPTKRTSVAADFIRHYSVFSRWDKLIVGIQHSLDPLTTVKARLDSTGKAMALIKHEWCPMSHMTVSVEVDTKAFKKGCKIGSNFSFNFGSG